MKHILERIKPIKAGMRLDQVITVDLMSAIRDAIFALSRGENLQAVFNGRIRRYSEGYSLFCSPGGTEAGAGSLHPFEVVLSSPPEGNTSTEPGWVKVALNSFLMKTALPTDRITITGLDYPFQLKVKTAPQQYIWLEINLSGENTSPVTPITASIKSGADWNGSGGEFFPELAKWSTSDGTYEGSGEEAENRKQTHAYLPIAYTYHESKISEFFGSAEYAPAGLPIADKVTLVQMVNSNLILGTTCGEGGVQIRNAHPWFAPMVYSEP